MNNVIDQFTDAIRSAGIEPPEHIIADGNLHRFPTNGKPTDDAGYYTLHDDEIPAGHFGCWRSGISENWRADIGREYTQEEKQAYRKHMQTMRDKRKAEERSRRKQARDNAKERWEKAKPETGEHAYLRRRGVKPYGIRSDGYHLLIPMRDSSGTLHSIQTIWADCTKRFLPYGRANGCYHAIGKPNGVLCIAEGYSTAASIHQATGHAVAVAFSAGNLSSVAQTLKTKYPDLKLILCADDDADKDNNQGITTATEAARSVDGYLAIPDFGQDRPEGVSDFNDLHQHNGLEAVKRAIANASTPARDEYQTSEENAIAGDAGGCNESQHLEQEQTEAESLKAAVERLAALSPLNYELVRDQEAKALKVRVGVLDKEIQKQRKGATTDEETSPLVEEVEPWPDPVSGAELLEEIRTTLTRYMVLPDGSAEALALWILGSYAYNAFRIWPKLTLTSPEKRCGKSTLLTGLLAPLVHRGLVASSITPAAIFRVIEAWKPTLLIDEADTFLNSNDEMRGIINSGHTKSGAFVVRTVGDNHEPTKFSTWSPMAIAMIKSPPGTILDRSIVVRLRRRLPGERVEKLPITFEDHCLDIRRRCKRWAEDHLDILRQAEPALPQSANDRALDNWTPLLAIAESVGGDWQAAALVSFNHLNIPEDEEEIGPMILEDIKHVFEDQAKHELHSIDLVAKLVEMEERPWSEWRHGKPLTTTSLARLLKPYRIKSKQLWIAGTNRHGYELKRFLDAFVRYLSPTEPDPLIQNAKTLESSNHAASSDFQNARNPQSLAFQNPWKPSNHAVSSVLAFQNHPIGDEAQRTDDVEEF